MAKILVVDDDTAILDIMMPGIDGFELCSKIRKEDEYEKIREKHFIIRRIILGILIVIIIAGGVYCRFGGFGTGKSADTKDLEKLWNQGAFSDEYTSRQRSEVIEAVKTELLENEKPAAVQAVHFADILLQNILLGDAMDDILAWMALRDKLMAENIMWILGQEEARGNSRIFISGHNGHVSQFGFYDHDNKYMGHILADEIGEASYFVIGTDFYKTTNNMPKGDGKRTKFTAYSHDPPAKAAKKCGYDICFLDFSKIPEASALKSEVTGYCYMGNFGENQMTLMNRIVMRALPYTYRIWGSPAGMYDGMIFVEEAHPIEIKTLSESEDCTKTEEENNNTNI